MKDCLEEYNKYHTDRDNERTGLFKSITEKYNIKSAMYAGSYTHITPSFFTPYVVYVDSYKKAQVFFDQPEVVKYINERKAYKENVKVKFYLSDYSKDFGEKEESFDLLISQYAGFISQACKKYLKIGGILIANNSHGDADMAHLDNDFEFIGVYNRKTDTQYSISEKELESYFIPKKTGLVITKDILLKKQSGTGYTKTPSGYIFKRIK